MSDLLSQFQTAFGADVASDAPDRFLEELRGRFKSPKRVLLRPRDTKGVAEIVRYCGENGIGIIPYSGGTGLVGGQIADKGKLLLLSLDRMNKCRAVHANEMIIEVDAGMILKDVQDHADRVNRLFPLSLGSEGTAQIGGNLSTNAGGVQVLRYGNARDLCLGLEAVLPNGEIFHGMKRLRKDNTGYDLRNLLIGAEGSLGIITGAALKLFPKPHEFGTAMAEVKSPNDAIELLAKIRDRFGDMVTGFELISGQGLTFLAEKLPKVRRPLSPDPAWSVLLEISGGLDADLKNRLVDFLGQEMEQGLIPNAVIAENETQRLEFWHVRESIPEASRAVGAIASHDISVPIGEIPNFIETMTPKIEAKGVRVNGFGHLGDGNLHYNIFPPAGKTREDYLPLREEITSLIYDEVHKLGGSISAEHGIGRLKVSELEKFGDPAKLSAMRSIKSALDPKGIMNPGAVLK